jgi:uncharacterized protein (TIGR03382 family)
MTRRSTRILSLALALCAGLGVAAFTRETTSPGNPGAGLCVWWGGRTLQYQVNATGLTSPPARGVIAPAPCGDPMLAVTTVEEAMATWGGATRTGEPDACTDFAFEPAPVVTTEHLQVANDGVTLIVFRAGKCSVVAAGDPCHATRGECGANYNCWDDARYDLPGHPQTIAITTFSFNPDTGRLRDAIIEINASDGAGSGTAFSCSGGAVTVGDLGAVVTHEAGHVLGLDHVCADPYDYSQPPAYRVCKDPASVMKPTVGDAAYRVLSQDDVAGICKIYPKGGPTSTCAPPQDSGGGGGCSSAGGVGVLALLGVLFAARRRRS